MNAAEARQAAERNAGINSYEYKDIKRRIQTAVDGGKFCIHYKFGSMGAKEKKIADTLKMEGFTITYEPDGQMKISY